MVLDLQQQEGKPAKKRYFHPECLEKWKGIDADLEEMDSLNEIIKRIHGVPAIHSSLWQWIQEVRMGTLRKGGRVIKKYREGIPYSVIEKAYELAEKDIQWAQQNKSGTWNAKADEKLAELRYCFAMVKDKIPLAFHRIKKADKARVDAERGDQMAVAPPIDETPVVFKKRDSKVDIRQMLND